jgi:phospholipase/carboxylesterase
MTVFDQADIRAEAAAFAAFMEGAVSGYGLDPARIAFLGYSNGANFAAAVMALYPEVIGRAVLLRSTPVLDPLPQADLSGADVLAVSGRSDPFGTDAPALVAWLEKHGARVRHESISAEHALTADDERIARDWFHNEERKA